MSAVLDNPAPSADDMASVARGACDGVACHNTASVSFGSFILCAAHAGWIHLAGFVVDPDRQHRRGPRSSG
jgi:hypothetical protein